MVVVISEREGARGGVVGTGGHDFLMGKRGPRQFPFFKLVKDIAVTKPGLELPAAA